VLTSQEFAQQLLQAAPVGSEEDRGSQV